MSTSSASEPEQWKRERWQCRLISLRFEDILQHIQGLKNTQVSLLCLEVILHPG